MLKFGTGGIRAIMGPNEGLMNMETVTKATIGVGKYLLDHCKAPKVIISYDSRNNSRDFALRTSKVLLALGVKADMFKELEPVPVLSYTIRAFKYDMGVVITASHNPKEYNGYKVYGPNGGQVIDEVAAEIENNINSYTGTLDLPLDKEPTFVEPIGYSEAMEKASDFTKERGIKVIYTPLYGSGRKHVVKMLEDNGFDYELVKEQAEPNGDFPTCPKPNPELFESYDIAKTYEGDIIIATDPDSDRCGVFLPKEDRILTGNEMGTLIAYYLAVSLKKKGTVVCSRVSTPIIDKICPSVIRTDVGFKWIGNKMDELGPDCLFGFEESCGFLVGDYARDKDGIEGCKLICLIAAYYKAQGKSLTDVLEEIYAKYGRVTCKQYSRELEKGEPKPESFVKEFADKSKVISRPSGTEPKVKYYIFAETDTGCEELIERIKKGRI